MKVDLITTFCGRGRNDHSASQTTSPSFIYSPFLLPFYPDELIFRHTSSFNFTLRLRSPEN